MSGGGSGDTWGRVNTVVKGREAHFFFFFFFVLVTKEREAKLGVYSTIQLERERNPTLEKAHLKGTVCFLHNQRLISNSH